MASTGTEEAEEREKGDIGAAVDEEENASGMRIYFVKTTPQEVSFGETSSSAGEAPQGPGRGGGPGTFAAKLGAPVSEEAV